MLNPVLKKIKYFLYYWLFWAIIAIIHFSVLLFFKKNSFLISFVDAFVYTFLFGIFGIGLWFVVFYNNLEKKTYLNIILSHLVILLTTIFLWITLGNFISSVLLNFFGESKLPSLEGSFLYRIISGILFYIVIVFSYYLNIYYSNFKDKITNEAKLQALVKEAELKAIKSQINPHFLFNSLNSISLQTLNNPDKAQEMIINLSSYLRYSISQKDKHSSSIKEEIGNCKKYLEIEKTRFGDKLQMEFDIDERCLGQGLPTMILQPLYENAIKHGVYESSQVVKISTIVKCYSDFVEISISNNTDPEAVPRKGEGFGIKSVSDRLKLVYGNENLFSTKKFGNTFLAKLIIPKTN